MNKQEIIQKIHKIFRANTIKVEISTGQYGQTGTEEQIENIDELKNDIIELIDSGFVKDKINKRDIFIGNRKLGASYCIDEPIEVAKKWGYKYVVWNEGEIIEVNGKRTGLKYDEI